MNFPLIRYSDYYIKIFFLIKVLFFWRYQYGYNFDTPHGQHQYSCGRPQSFPFAPRVIRPPTLSVSFEFGHEEINLSNVGVRTFGTSFEFGFHTAKTHKITGLFILANWVFL